MATLGMATLGKARKGKDMTLIACHIDYGLINLATGEQTAERGTICIRSTMKMPTLRQAALKTAQDKYQIPGVVAVTGVRIVKFTNKQGLER